MVECPQWMVPSRMRGFNYFYGLNGSLQPNRAVIFSLNSLFSGRLSQIRV